ncbi:Imm30 family immunity protein [Massilia sp. Root351]|uniref:Imm30 family immunity protein n=1 Tax=Massilia sp. Root351 TaxID=1736522 RepID=UPI0009E8890D|nr:Imm30 family immunity protein [Massilia sp. Root351]
MNTILKSKFLELTSAIKKNDLNSVGSIDAVLADIAKENDPSTVAVLLLSLDDNFDFDEGVFSIIHTAEAFDDQTYIPGFLATIPHLFQSSPRWASIVLIRILNHAGSKEALIKSLMQSPEPTKKAVEQLCNQINDQSTDFLSKTVAVLVATK